MFSYEVGVFPARKLMKRPVRLHKPQDSITKLQAAVFRVDHAQKARGDFPKLHKPGIESRKNALLGKIEREPGKFELIEGIGVQLLSFRRLIGFEKPPGTIASGWIDLPANFSSIICPRYRISMTLFASSGAWAAILKMFPAAH